MNLLDMTFYSTTATLRTEAHSRYAAKLSEAGGVAHDQTKVQLALVTVRRGTIPSILPSQKSASERTFRGNKNAS